ncbi:hypothetical protein ACIBHY_23745 [Nonomuraea sp. NPDC050547]|uniref:hypothetical protein n=1 Tax=unclassified Nonomuraea TaxID=2593643 RepID=UPI0037917230
MADGNTTRGRQREVSLAGKQALFAGDVLGPHFEQVRRDWALHHAEPDLLGGLSARVGTPFHDPVAHTGHEIDLPALYGQN